MSSLACSRRFLWKQGHAGRVGAHPFTHPIADAPCSVDLNVRIMRCLHNVIILIQRFRGFLQDFQLLFLSSLSSYFVHEIIHVVWTSIQEKALSSTFKLFSFAWGIFFPLALLWTISHSCIWAKIFHEASRIYWIHMFILFFPLETTFLLQSSLEKKLTTETALTLCTTLPILHELLLLGFSGNHWGSIQNCK